MPNNAPLPLDPFHDPDMPSLAEALSRFELMPDETPSRKTRVRTAVATIGRLLHKPPAELSTQPTYLKQWFRHFKHRPTGLTAKSLANCKTEIRYLVRKVCGRGRKSGFRPLAPEWVQVCELIADKPIRWRLTRFMAFCSSAGIAPEDVDDGVVEQYQAAVQGFRRGGEARAPSAHDDPGVESSGRDLAELATGDAVLAPGPDLPLDDRSLEVSRVVSARRGPLAGRVVEGGSRSRGRPNPRPAPCVSQGPSTSGLQGRFGPGLRRSADRNGDLPGLSRGIRCLQEDPDPSPGAPGWRTDDRTPGPCHDPQGYRQAQGADERTASAEDGPDLRQLCPRAGRPGIQEPGSAPDFRG